MHDIFVLGCGSKSPVFIDFCVRERYNVCVCVCDREREYVCVRDKDHPRDNRVEIRIEIACFH